MEVSHSLKSHVLEDWTDYLSRNDLQHILCNENIYCVMKLKLKPQTNVSRNIRQNHTTIARSYQK